MTGDEITVPLHAVAHARACDKGNRSNISLIAYRPEAMSNFRGWGGACARFGVDEDCFLTQRELAVRPARIEAHFERTSE